MSNFVEPPPNSIPATSRAFFWIRIFSTPFYVVFTLLPYILYKDLGATLFQTTLLVALKPAISLVAPYVSINLVKRPDRIVRYILGAGIMKYLPFLFIPWIQSVWLFIAFTLFYLILERGVMPAWIEFLKEGLPKEKRTKLFSFTQAIDYLGIALFPLTLGWLLDTTPESWRVLFPLCALLALSPLFLLRNVSHKRPMASVSEDRGQGQEDKIWLRPWKASIELILSRRDFALFQLGFMMGGSGLMLIQAGLPLIFTDILHLSYQEISFAIAFCKGIGFALSSPFWARWFNRQNIFFFCSRVTLLSLLFPFFLLFAQFDLAFVYIGYLIYGVMQGGSELSWHMSGPTFEEKGDSSLYTTTNVLAQGVRGAVMPFLGYLICQFIGVYMLLGVAALFAIMATTVMMRGARLSYARTDAAKDPLLF